MRSSGSSSIRAVLGGLSDLPDVKRILRCLIRYDRLSLTESWRHCRAAESTPVSAPTGRHPRLRGSPRHIGDAVSEIILLSYRSPKEVGKLWQ